MAFKQKEVDQLLAETGHRWCLCGTLHKVQIQDGRGALKDPGDIDRHFRHNSRLAKWMNDKRQEAIDIFNSILAETIRPCAQRSHQ